MSPLRLAGWMIVLALAAGCTGTPGPKADAPARSPIERRPVAWERDGRWIGHGISFSPYRDGQAPGGMLPSADEIREDLGLVAPHWPLIRLYDAGPVAERTLAIIRRERLPLAVMLGVWVAPEIDAAARQANRAQAEAAVRLARDYADLVMSVVVGNETCVSWSGHRMGPAALIPWIREVRGRVRQPVATADDYSFWATPESHAVAAEVDFIVLHAYALWNGRRLEEAMEWTGRIVAEAQQRHAGIPLVLGETGWATSHDASRRGPGEEGTLMRAEVSVRAQQEYLRQHYRWVRQHRVPTILFEAFDENWKGGGAATSPAAAEKHWGVFTADRRPKASLLAVLDELP